jgi:hypothetical protein
VTDGVDGGGTWTAATAARPGWYPDPWLAGQHRYWTGQQWTADVFPDGPTHPDPDPLPDWSPYDPEPESPPPAGPKSGRPLAVVALVVGLIVGFVAVIAIVNAVTDKSTPKQAAATPTVPTGPAATLPPETAPAGPVDPNQSSLSGLVLGQADVPTSFIVQPLSNGDAVTGQATLDVCNGTFPSEDLRTARLQVAAIDAQNNSTLSTEAVLYKNGAATTQAFAELKSVAASCPATPVASPVGEPTVATHFNAAPDGAWPQTPTVDRLAFDFTTTNAAGQSQHSIGVYLRRGRVLMGVYFPQPGGPQMAVGGKTTPAEIVNLFAGRIAQLPATVVNGG